MHLILLVLALFCFVVSAVPVAASVWSLLISLGLAALVASKLPWR